MNEPVIVMAWDGYTEEPLRILAFGRTLQHLKPLGWRVELAKESHRPYRLPRAVNRAVDDLDCDVLLIHYADVIVPHVQIREAVRLASEAPGQVFAFDRYVRVGEPGGVEVVIEDAPANACMAIQRECFLEVGGYDERFVGWGMEDRIFNTSCELRWPARRVLGRLEHLWHGDRREDDSCLETSEAQVRANRELYARLRDG